ncbi:MAG TPA: hypothetical protein VFO31_21805, partial [Vicinamibacterales bacterium]|nr:hypothetical protein [Vicinamibacterales bacterium]
MESNRRGFTTLAFSAALMVIGALIFSPAATAAQSRMSRPFAGVKANTGSVTLSSNGSVRTLTLSEDFKA